MWYARYTHRNLYWLPTKCWINMGLIFHRSNHHRIYRLICSHPARTSSLWLLLSLFSVSWFFFLLFFVGICYIPCSVSSSSWSSLLLQLLVDFSIFFLQISCSFCGQRLKFLRISGCAHISLKSWVNAMWQLKY